MQVDVRRLPVFVDIGPCMIIGNFGSIKARAEVTFAVDHDVGARVHPLISATFEIKTSDDRIIDIVRWNSGTVTLRSRRVTGDILIQRAEYSSLVRPYVIRAVALNSGPLKIAKSLMRSTGTRHALRSRHVER